MHMLLIRRLNAEPSPFGMAGLMMLPAKPIDLERLTVVFVMGIDPTDRATNPAWLANQLARAARALDLEMSSLRTGRAGIPAHDASLSDSAGCGVDCSGGAGGRKSLADSLPSVTSRMRRTNSKDGT
jgi:hypothetical protein